MTIQPAAGLCFWCQHECGGTCLGLRNSTQMDIDDPAYWMLTHGETSSTDVYKRGCYICEDPEYAQMGVSLCQACAECSAKAGKPAGHVPADDEECDECGWNARVAWQNEQARKD